MRVPGANVLKIAMRALGAQFFSYYAFLQRVTTAIGMDVTIYSTPASLQGSIQPVDRKLYEQMGLDLLKNYAFFYVAANAIDIDRDVSGDQFRYNGQVWQCVSRTNWFAQDGWVNVLCVQVPNFALVSNVAPPAAGDYVTGAHLDFVLTFSAAVSVDTSDGTPQIPLIIGANARNAVYLSGSGTPTLTFRYTIASDDAAPDGISMAQLVDLNGGLVTSGMPSIPANPAYIAPDLSGVNVNA